MSLTSHLKDPASPVHRFVRERFPRVRAVVRPANADLKGAGTIRPEGDVHWGTIGTAVDHRIRYYFGPAHEAGAVQGGAFMLKRGMMRGTLGEDPDELTRFAGQAEALGDLVPGFFGGLDEALARLRPWREPRPRLAPEEERLLCRYCVGLALFEQVFRIGRVSPGSLLADPEPARTADELLARVPDAWVDDLSSLSRAFSDSQGDLLRGAREARLGPTFDGSHDVGGADADLILDGCLVDIKTTTTPKVTAEMIRQLVGYVLLDYSGSYGIEEVAIYLSRQQRLVRWSLKELLSELCDPAIDVPPPALEMLRDAFRSAVGSKPDNPGFGK